MRDRKRNVSWRCDRVATGNGSSHQLCGYKILKQLSCGMRLAMGGLVIATISYVRAGTFSSDFESDPTPFAYLTGWAYWSSSGGVGDSGVIHLTDAFNGQEGSLIIEDLNAIDNVGFTYYDDGCSRSGNGSAQIHANAWVYVQSDS